MGLGVAPKIYTSFMMGKALLGKLSCKLTGLVNVRISDRRTTSFLKEFMQIKRGGKNENGSIASTEPMHLKIVWHNPVH